MSLVSFLSLTNRAPKRRPVSTESLDRHTSDLARGPNGWSRPGLVRHTRGPGGATRRQDLLRSKAANASAGERQPSVSRAAVELRGHAVGRELREVQAHPSVWCSSAWRARSDASPSTAACSPELRPSAHAPPGSGIAAGQQLPTSRRSNEETLIATVPRLRNRLRGWWITACSRSVAEGYQRSRTVSILRIVRIM
jgi:hypothetical protein